MMRKEFEKSLRVSPENYTYGRVDTVCVSQADHIRTDIEKPEPETRLIETSTQEHVVFARRTSERPRNKEQKSDVSPWEPFNLEPNPNQRFINLYGGPFSQQMELNRVNADRLLEVAAIQGRVILTDVPMDRNRVIAGVNADGSVSKKRNLFFGEKLEEDESKTLVKPIPEGWKIEIPGQDILDEISRKKSRRT